MNANCGVLSLPHTRTTLSAHRGGARTTPSAHYRSLTLCSQLYAAAAHYGRTEGLPAHSGSACLPACLCCLPAL